LRKTAGTARRTRPKKAKEGEVCRLEVIPELSLGMEVLIIASDQRRRRRASYRGGKLPLPPSQRAYTRKRVNKALSPYLRLWRSRISFWSFIDYPRSALCQGLASRVSGIRLCLMLEAVMLREPSMALLLHNSAWTPLKANPYLIRSATENGINTIQSYFQAPERRRHSYNKPGD
jgi:hypothetical protein